jgi:adenosylmethionine-8-amino-7-oxononanoate aminotransferase
MQPGIRYLQERLQKDFLSLPHVSDVRQWGYMVGIELVQDKATQKNYAPDLRIGHQVILEARKRSVLIRPLGDIIILMPPLTIAVEELSALLDVVYESIQIVTGNS